MQIRVGIKEDDKDVICRAQTELIMSQLKRKNADITFKKYSIKQEKQCNQTDIYIPKTGEAVSAVLTSSSLDIVNAVSCISDNNSLKCIDIESSVIHDLMMYGYIQEARAIASIEKDCLTINACIYSHDKSLRMSRSGKLSDSEEIMKKLVSGITGKI